MEGEELRLSRMPGSRSMAREKVWLSISGAMATPIE